MNRILIIGVSCSGKSTFAKKVSEAFNLPFCDLDDLFWLPQWKIRPFNEFTELLKEKADQQNWVFAGNYYRESALAWERATTIIWLDYSLSLVLWRGFTRCIVRSLSRKQICNGNRESFFRHFFSKQSILLWILKSYPRRKKKFPELLSQFSAEVVVLKTPSEAKNWVCNAYKAQ